MGNIVLEDFNEGNGYYKINLAYLNKEQVEEIEALVSKWKPTDEDIKSCIAMCLTDANEQRFKDYGTNLKDCLAWLEKQGDVDKKIIQYREYLVSETERWHKAESDKTRSAIGKQDCIGHANAFISARSEFEKVFNWDTLIEKQGKSKFEQCFQDGDKIVTNEDGTHFNISQLERVVKKESNPAWSEEDEENLNKLHKLIVKKAYEEYEIDTEDETLYGKWLKLDNWLKTLKDRVQLQPKQEWSEDDESKIESICRLLKTRFYRDTCDEVGFTRDEMCDYLISLKNRIQPQWKPSDEQMKGIDCAIKTLRHQLNVEDKRLNSLYEQLKNL